MSYINPADLSWHGDEAKGISEAVLTKAFQDSQDPISKLHNITTGIKAKKQIPFLGTFGMVGKKKAGCDTTPNAGSITMSEKFWEPAFVSDRLSTCWDVMKASFFEWGSGNGLSKENLDGTDFAVFLQSRLGESMKDTIWRLAWFGDTAADDSSAGGVLTTGTDEGFFTPVDGLWKQIFAVVAADSTKKLGTAGFASSINLTTKNAQTTTANQMFNSTDTTNKLATTLLQKIKFAADMRLRNDTTGYILVTQSIMDQYEIERSSQNLESGIQILENGMSMVKVGGIPVYSVPFWDRYIATYYNNGTKLHLPHRAVYSTKTNMPIGVEEESNLSEMDAFYDQVNKKYIVDFAFNFDVKFLESHMGMFAY